MANVMLRGACLREADMSGAQLDAAVLIEADLRKANLRGAGFRHAMLDAADLRDARLGGAFLVGASLRGADLRGAYVRLAKRSSPLFPLPRFDAGWGSGEDHPNTRPDTEPVRREGAPKALRNRWLPQGRVAKGLPGQY
jgi:hypothetical protein